MNEHEIKLEITEKKITGFYNQDGYCITVKAIDLPFQSTFFLLTNEKNFEYYRFFKANCEIVEAKAREQMKHSAGDMKAAFDFNRGGMYYFIWNGNAWVETDIPATK